MLKDNIGINAEAILKLLSENGKLSLKQLCESLNDRESLTLLALGWLSRENKINISSDTNGRIFIELDNPPTETFY